MGGTVVICSAVRTPIGSFGGIFKDVSATKLGVVVAKAAIERAGIRAEQVEETIFGNCMMRTDELNTARCISLEAGIPFDKPAFSIQRQCASGMQAIVSAYQQILCGEHECVLAGGVENMSRVPYVLDGHRWGQRMWDGVITDALTQGLTDPIGHFHMGVTAENLAEEFAISREEQDALAATSHERAIHAINEGYFKNEIIPVEIPRRKKEALICDTDEHPKQDATIEKLSMLKPVFKKENGTVTAGNASGINDGAAAMIICSLDFAKKNNLQPLATIIDHQVAAVEPERMGIGPLPAVSNLLKRQNLSVNDIDLFEVNEAFAAQYLACEKTLKLNRENTNISGSGIALGHPVGATGCRITVTLLHHLQRLNLKRGIATLCVGGGMGKALMIEKI